MHRFKPPYIFLSAGALIVIAIFTACAGGPGSSPVEEPAAQAPAWTMETPAPSGGSTYFVGYADGPLNGEVQASEAATASLIAEIMRYIGVTITAESTATARSTVDDFEADLIQTVRQSSTNRVAGFQINERYVQKRQNGITVYLLGQYTTRDLEAEKRRIAALFQEKIDAVAIPEAEGWALLEDGDTVGAIRKFLNAAAAAAGAEIENSAIKFERNINNAKDALARVGFEKLNDNLEAYPGQPFDTPFIARLSSTNTGLTDAPVMVSYQSRLPNGRRSTKNQNILSDADGIVTFNHPSPDFVGKAVLTMRLDLSSALEPLYDVDGPYRSMVAGLEDEIVSKRVDFQYTVISRAKDVPTAVIVADVDAAGNPSLGTTSASLLQTLSSAGFSVSSAPLSPVLIALGVDSDIAAAANTQLSGKADRLIYGRTRIVGVRDDNGQKIATLSADIRAIELSTGKILYSAIKQTPAVASTEAGAIEAARRLLGQKNIGEELIAQLP